MVRAGDGEMGIAEEFRYESSKSDFDGGGAGVVSHQEVPHHQGLPVHGPGHGHASIPETEPAKVPDRGRGPASMISIALKFVPDVALNLKVCPVRIRKGSFLPRSNSFRGFPDQKRHPPGLSMG